MGGERGRERKARARDSDDNDCTAVYSGALARPPLQALRGCAIGARTSFPASFGPRPREAYTIAPLAAAATPLSISTPCLRRSHSFFLSLSRSRLIARTYIQHAARIETHTRVYGERAGRKHLRRRLAGVCTEPPRPPSLSFSCVLSFCLSIACPPNHPPTQPRLDDFCPSLPPSLSRRGRAARATGGAVLFAVVARARTYTRCSLKIVVVAGTLLADGDDDEDVHEGEFIRL